MVSRKSIAQTAEQTNSSDKKLEDPFLQKTDTAYIVSKDFPVKGKKINKQKARLVKSSTNPQLSDTITKANAAKLNLNKVLDTTLLKIKGASNNLTELLKDRVNKTEQNISNSFAALKKIRKDSIGREFIPTISLKTLLKTRPFISHGKGYISYNVNYRSSIDTPIAERNVLQQNINGSVSLSVAAIPLKTNFLLRRSNSSYFSNINDIQCEFDVNTFRGNLQNNFQQQLLNHTSGLKDNLLELQYKLACTDLEQKDNWLKNPFSNTKAN